MMKIIGITQINKFDISMAIIPSHYYKNKLWCHYQLNNILRPEINKGEALQKIFSLGESRWCYIWVYDVVIKKTTPYEIKNLFISDSN